MLREHDDFVNTKEICRKYGNSDTAAYRFSARWKSSETLLD